MLSYRSSPGWSCLEAHPLPSFGTMLTFGSLPLFSAFRLGRLAGGGMRRLAATLPRLWSPCLAATEWNIKKDQKYVSYQKVYVNFREQCFKIKPRMLTQVHVLSLSLSLLKLIWMHGSNQRTKAAYLMQWCTGGWLGMRGSTVQDSSPLLVTFLMNNAYTEWVDFETVNYHECTINWNREYFKHV